MAIFFMWVTSLLSRPARAWGSLGAHQARLI